jgi:hypothetical protein
MLGLYIPSGELGKKHPLHIIFYIFSFFTPKKLKRYYPAHKWCGYETRGACLASHLFIYFTLLDTISASP